MRILTASLVVFLSFSTIASAQTKYFDLTPAFVDCGVDIEQLLVYRVGEIVVIRGTTSDAEKAANAGRIATVLGYDRVANLIVVVDQPLTDAAIAARGQLALDREPALDGCRFHVASVSGLISVSGRTLRNDQKNLAVEVLKHVAGVKDAHWD
ncbi:MAG TPA: BON domain-containing protein [Thermoanaerobaculia bacterium]